MCTSVKENISRNTGRICCISAKMTIILFSLIVQMSCGGGSSGTLHSNSAGVDTVPQIASDNESVEVTATGNLKVSFVADMNAASINSNTLKVNGPAGSVAGTAVYGSAKTATFTPDAPLAPLTDYTVTLTTDIKDLAGNSLSKEHKLTVKTGPSSSTTPAVAATDDVTASINGLPGAVGDGDAANASRNTAAINAHIVAMAARGGGDVVVPKGWFKTNGPIAVRDNIHLLGAGYESHIDNIATSGFAKCTVITGNLGDIGGNSGMYAETRYNLNTIAAGATTISFLNTADAATFVVGDVVAITSFDRQPTDTRYPMYNDLNVITAKSGAVLSLKYAVADSYSNSHGNPSVARLSGSVNGYDGQRLWMAKNANVDNLRLTNATGLASGWYALFANGISNTYQNIWVDNASGIIGSNGLSHSTIKGIKGGFDLRGIDLSDFQVSNLLEDITISRIGLNALLPKNAMGVGIYSGSDITVSGLNVNLAGIGQVSMMYVNRGKYTNYKVMNAGTGVNVGILSGYGIDMEISNGTLDGSDRHGIYVVGERARINGNTISNTGKTGAFPSIGIRAGVVEYTVENNICGINGSRTANDTVKIFGAASATGIIRNNTTF